MVLLRFLVIFLALFSLPLGMADEEEEIRRVFLEVYMQHRVAGERLISHEEAFAAAENIMKATPAYTVEVLAKKRPIIDRVLNDYRQTGPFPTEGDAALSYLRKNFRRNVKALGSTPMALQTTIAQARKVHPEQELRRVIETAMDELIDDTRAHFFKRRRNSLALGLVLEACTGHEVKVRYLLRAYKEAKHVKDVRTIALMAAETLDNLEPELRAAVLQDLDRAAASRYLGLGGGNAEGFLEELAEQRRASGFGEAPPPPAAPRQSFLNWCFSRVFRRNR